MASVAREWREIPGRYNTVGTKCGVCGKIFFPARSLCPKCRRASLGKMERYDVADEGEVYTFSIVHDAPDANNRMKPYAVGMIKTTDGVLLTGQIVDVDLKEIEIGMKVRTVLRKIYEDGDAGVIHYGFKFVPKR